MTKKRMIAKIYEYLEAIPISDRKKLAGITFIIEEDTAKISKDGGFIRGEYFPDSQIVFYASMIPTERALKEVFLHEIAHQVGMNEDQVGRFIRGVFK